MKKAGRLGNRLGVASAFALGATAGSLATLVCAPQSGQVVRRRLLQKARGFQKTAERQLGKTKRLIVNQADQFRDTAIDTIDQARDWVTQRVANGKHKVSGHRRIVRRRAIRTA